VSDFSGFGTASDLILGRGPLLSFNLLKASLELLLFQACPSRGITQKLNYPPMQGIPG